MKFEESNPIGGRHEFLASPNHLDLQHVFSADTKAGTPVEITDGLGNKHVGICLNDVVVADNPNGAVVYFGLVDATKLTAAKTSSADYYPTITFIENKED